MGSFSRRKYQKNFGRRNLYNDLGFCVRKDTNIHENKSIADLLLIYLLQTKGLSPMVLPNDIRKTIFKSVFLIIRWANLPAMNKFISVTVTELKLKESSPSDWKTFWAEVLAGQIQQDCRNDLKIFINGFSYHWFNDGSKTMKDLFEYINENQLPVE
jgi:hypothetical protein